MYFWFQSQLNPNYIGFLKVFWKVNTLLCVTTEILAEYAEIIEQQMGTLPSENALGVIENLSNVELVTTHYKFGLLKDEDDNKFVDCAIACNADFIITHDKDFKPLKDIGFPKVSIIDTEQFKQIINQ